MSADFFAGYISGAIGILIGNPLDLIKVRLQAGTLSHISPISATPSRSSSPILASLNSSALPIPTRTSYSSQFTTFSTLLRGTSVPILGYGALNALLFMTYNRTSSYLTYGSLAPPSTTTTTTTTTSSSSPLQQPTLFTTFIAGALGGLATWIISTPTELIKCRAQVSSSSSQSHSTSPTSSYTITKSILRSHGLPGLYAGGVVTSLRDSIGYGFYFWTYEATTRALTSYFSPVSGNDPTTPGAEAAKVLLCGGLAGVVTWASVFPLDVIKTRVQTQTNLFAPEFSTSTARGSLLGIMNGGQKSKMGAIEIAKTAYRNEGAGVFFKGLGICSVRAFVVNAAQWAVYEWVMREFGRGKD